MSMSKRNQNQIVQVAIIILLFTIIIVEYENNCINSNNIINPIDNNSESERHHDKTD